MMTALVHKADSDAFKVCFNRLAKAKRATDVDGATMVVYLQTLAALPMWAIEQAAAELQRTPTFGFPTTDVWYQAAEAEVQRRLRDTIAAPPRAWHEECRGCHDSGWVELFCTSESRCGRPFCDKLGEKHEHAYYAVCNCRPTNSTYQRNTAASQLGHGQSKEAKH